MSLPRSYLFVPGDRPDRFAKALASGADAVIIDLEDAVASAAKVDARDRLANWLQTGRPEGLQDVVPELWVRVNAVGTAWHDDDMALVGRAAISGVVLPKAEALDELRAVSDRLGLELHLMPLVESARGMAHASAIASADKVQRLLFGSIDLQLDLGMQADSEESELLSFRMHTVLASRLAGIAAPVDGVTVAIEDPAALAQAVQRARRMGFGGKLCIHPKQVAGVNSGFRPGEHELAWARRVMAAVKDNGHAAVKVDGEMIDSPVLARARRLLEHSAR